MKKKEIFRYNKDKKEKNGGYRFPYLRALLVSKSSFKDFPRANLKASTMLNGKEIGFRLRNFQGHIIPEGFCSLKQAFSHSYNTYFSYLALHGNRMFTHDSLVYDEQINEKYKKKFSLSANCLLNYFFWIHHQNMDENRINKATIEI